jgi:hypothetical protein
MKDQQQKARWTTGFADPPHCPMAARSETWARRDPPAGLSEREQMQRKWQDAASRMIKSTTLERG